jgi:hypothetical protein
MGLANLLFYPTAVQKQLILPARMRGKFQLNVRQHIQQRLFLPHIQARPQGGQGNPSVHGTAVDETVLKLGRHGLRQGAFTAAAVPVYGYVDFQGLENKAGLMVMLSKLEFCEGK